MTHLGRRALALAALLAFAPEVRAQEPTLEVTVQPGETCRSLAARIYGDAEAYDRIHAHNPQMGPPPHRLVPGTVLRVPRPEPPARLSAVHRVVERRDPDDAAFAPARTGQPLPRGTQVRTHDASSAEITFRDRAEVTVRERTLVIVYGGRRRLVERAITRASSSAARCAAASGELAGRRPLEVETPSSHASLDGDAVVSVEDDGTSRVANHGERPATVVAGGARVVLPGGTGTVVRQGERPARPRRLLAAPRWRADHRGPVLGFVGRGASLRGGFDPVRGAARYRVEIARRPRRRRAARDARARRRRVALRGRGPARGHRLRVRLLDRRGGPRGAALALARLHGAARAPGRAGRRRGGARRGAAARPAGHVARRAARPELRDRRRRAEHDDHAARAGARHPGVHRRGGHRARAARRRRRAASPRRHRRLGARPSQPARALAERAAAPERARARGARAGRLPRRSRDGRGRRARGRGARAARRAEPRGDRARDRRRLGAHRPRERRAPRARSGRRGERARAGAVSRARAARAGGHGRARRSRVALDALSARRGARRLRRVDLPRARGRAERRPAAARRGRRARTAPGVPLRLAFASQLDALARPSEVDRRGEADLLASAGVLLGDEALASRALDASA
ncbi:MAG: LysM peptidoglycan-binding domain-containing protein [Sandaracinaceae bacterium]|nr:LysM peptidoglycan-binding domain-containing protein [Sandaracinaceae bacterium]